MKDDQETQMAGFTESFENAKSDFLSWAKTNWKWILGIGTGIGMITFAVKKKRGQLDDKDKSEE